MGGGGFRVRRTVKRCRKCGGGGGSASGALVRPKVQDCVRLSGSG